jgi:hypothetical protein
MNPSDHQSDGIPDGQVLKIMEEEKAMGDLGLHKDNAQAPPLRAVRQ